MAKKYPIGEQLEKILRECEEEIKSEWEGCLKKYTSLILEDALDNVPIKTGTLAGSLKYKFLNGGTIGKVYSDTSIAGYGYIVEKGNATRFPKPYLHPAFDKYKDDFLEEAQKILDKVLGH